MVWLLFLCPQRILISSSTYIANQKQHHEKKDFKEEFREFLEKYGIEYDERYVWD